MPDTPPSDLKARQIGIDTTTPSVGLRDILRVAVDNIEVVAPESVAPTEGRVIESPSSGDVFVGAGGEFVNIDHAVTLDLAGLPGVVVVRSADDLPAAENGTRQLEPGVAYLFTEFVTDDATLELASTLPSPILGWHGGTGGYIHTGGSVAISGTDADLLMRDCYIHAPGGTIFDLEADDTTEMLVESVAYSDAAGIAPIGSLGTIDGYRVPTFKGVNFESYADGLTFTGVSDKVLISQSVFRNPAAETSSVIFDADFETNSIDIAGNYFKGHEATGSVGIETVAGYDLNQFGIVRGNLFEDIGDGDEIEGFDPQEIEWQFVANSGVIDSGVKGSFTIDDNTTVTITESATDKFDGDAFAQVEQSVTAADFLERTEVLDVEEAELTYVGVRGVALTCQTTVSISGTNDEMAIGIFQNGELLTPSATRFELQGAGAINASTSVNVLVESGDVFDVRVANLESTDDPTVGDMTFTVTD